MDFTIDGKTYLIGPFDLGDFGSVEAYLIRKRRKERLQLISDMRGDLPEDLWREEWEKAKVEAQTITKIDPKEIGGWDEIGEDGKTVVTHHDGWLDTREGLAYTLWLMLERKYPGEFTLETLQTKITEMALTEFEELKIARDQTAGLDEAGKNSTGPSAS
jgi:hypothetical protein